MRIFSKEATVKRSVLGFHFSVEKKGFFRKKTGPGLKKTETGGILIDSDVVYPEYDVRKVLESGSSGTPFFSGHLSLLLWIRIPTHLLIQTELNEEQS